MRLRLSHWRAEQARESTSGPRMNIVEPILFQARHCPPAPAMCAPGVAFGLISYARLADLINNVGRSAISFGLSRGQIVAIRVSDQIFHAALALGLINIGIVVLSTGGALPPRLRIDAMISDAPASVGAASAPRIIPCDASWISGDGRPPEATQLYRGSGDDIYRICLTSGSTGEAKALELSHNLELARLARYSHLFGSKFPECSRFFSDLGLTSGIGFRQLLYVLSRGGMMMFPGATPMDTLQAFDLYKMQGLVASPGGLSAFVKFYEANPAFRSSFQVIMSAGSPLNDLLSERVRARICSDLIFSYGTTETSFVSSAPAHALIGTPGAVGYCAPDMSVEIVDGVGTLLPPGTEGSVRIGSPLNVRGYAGDPESSAALFRDRCFYTGDVGYLTKDNMLVITGREKNVLNLGGDKVKPESIEAAVTAFADVGEAAVFTRPNDLGIDEVWALVVPKNGAFDETALRRHCRGRLADAHVPVRFIGVTALPRNANGKVERRRLSEIAMAGLRVGEATGRD
jgi:acyl-coenzyme A synthetase/AMP-(fatty) acid ligase